MGRSRKVFIAAAAVLATVVASTAGPSVAAGAGTTATVSGQVTFSNSEMIVSNATVKLTALEMTAVGPLGDYELANIAPGTYDLRVIIDATEVWSQTITLADGDTLTVNPSVTKTGPMGDVSGTAFDGTSPMAGKSIYLLDGAPVALSQIAADGSYRLRGITPGTYTLLLYDMPSGTVHFMQDVTVTDGVDLVVPIVLNQPALGALTGHVAATNSSVLLQDAQIDVFGPGVSLTVPVAIPGDYSIPSIPAGSYTVNVTRQGMSLAEELGVVVSAGVTSTVDFSFALPDVGSVDGTVVDANGAPLTGATVALISLPDEQPVWAQVTGLDGAFSTSGVPAGTYRIVAAFMPAAEVFDEEVIAVVAGETVVVHLSEPGVVPLGSVEGAVSADNSTVPVIDAEVTIDNGTFTATTTTRWGLPATYAFDSVPAGSYTVTIRVGGTIAGSRAVEVAGGLQANGDVTVTYPELGAIEGEVVDVSGPTLLAGYDIVLLTPSGAPLGEAVTSAAGAYQYPSVPPGDYLLWLGTADRSLVLQSQAVTVAANEPTQADFLIDLPSLVGASGATVENGEILYVSSDGLTDVAIEVDAGCGDGSAPESVALVLDRQTFAATPVPPAGHFVSVVPWTSLIDTDLFVDTACAGVSVLRAPVGSIALFDPSGHVTDAWTGEPLAGAQVTLYRVPGWIPRTDPDDVAFGTCESNASRLPGAGWSQPAPVSLGVLADPDGGQIQPAANPVHTGATGAFGWEVAEGCWYVTVSLEGYEPLVSPVVGVPTAVTDLDLELTPIPPVTVPDRPAGVAGIAGDAEVTVSWLTPGFDGGSPITGYTVTASPGGASCVTALLSCVVGGLSNGTAYTFTVVATNALGDSAPSLPSEAVIPVDPSPPATVPGAPRHVVAVGGRGQALIFWLPPASDGGSEITGYTVSASSGDGTCTTAQHWCVVTGLRAGREYRFAVTATNAVGTSAPSTPSNPVRVFPGRCPAVPAVLPALARPGLADVCWERG